MPPSSRRHAIAACLVSLLALAAGCGSKKSTPPNTELQLTQEEADDVVQQLAYMTAADSGGWILEVQSTFKAIPKSVAATPSLGRGPELRMRVPVGIERDTVVAGGQMFYNFHYEYIAVVNNQEVRDPVWDSTKVQVEAMFFTSPNSTVTPTAGNGNYFHHGGTINVYDLKAPEDSLTFSGLDNDTSLAVIHSRGGVHYYFMNDDFLDYDLKMGKLDSEDGFTMKGTAQVLYQADKLRSPSPGDVERSIYGEFNLVLNGTEQVVGGILGPWAEATIAEDVLTPTIYRYFVNLRTGAIQRR